MAPASDSTPPTIQARYTSQAEPTACIISAGTRKMPLPMIVPTTIALAWLTPRSRDNVGARLRIPETFTTVSYSSLEQKSNLLQANLRERTLARKKPGLVGSGLENSKAEG